MLKQINIDPNFLIQIFSVFVDRHPELILELIGKNQPKKQKEKVGKIVKLLQTYSSEKCFDYCRFIFGNNYDVEGGFLLRPHRFYLCRGKVAQLKPVNGTLRTYWYKTDTIISATAEPLLNSPVQASAYKNMEFWNTSFWLAGQDTQLVNKSDSCQYFAHGKFIPLEVIADPNDLMGLFWDWFTNLEMMRPRDYTTTLEVVHAWSSLKIQLGVVKETTAIVDLPVQIKSIEAERFSHSQKEPPKKIRKRSLPSTHRNKFYESGSSIKRNYVLPSPI